MWCARVLHQQKMAPVAHGRVGEARGEVDERIWTEAVLSLPLWHNLTREPGGSALAAAIAQWVRAEALRV